MVQQDEKNNMKRSKNEVVCVKRNAQPASCIKINIYIYIWGFLSYPNGICGISKKNYG